jgi:hypothetical protein
MEIRILTAPPVNTLISQNNVSLRVVLVMSRDFRGLQSLIIELP